MAITETPPRPAQRKRGSPEGRVQAECVQWFWNEYPQYRGLLFHCPNEGNRSSKTDGAYRKALGLISGVSDLILLIPNKLHHALCIEMKTEVGRQSESQILWQSKVEAQGFRYEVVRSLEEFKRLINEYLSL